MKLKKLLYSGAILGAVGVATIVPITINASKVNKTSIEDDSSKEDVPDQNYSCSVTGYIPNTCGYTTANAPWSRIINSIDVVGAASNYVEFTITPTYEYSQSGNPSTGNSSFWFASSAYDYTNNPTNSGTASRWYWRSDDYMPSSQTLIINLVDDNSYIPSGGTVFSVNKPTLNAGVKIHFYWGYSEDGYTIDMSSDWTLNSLLSGAPGSGKYFYVPGIMNGSEYLAFNESNQGYSFSYTYMPGVFYTGENGITAPDGSNKTYAQDNIYLRLFNETTWAYIEDTHFSDGTLITKVNEPASGLKWSKIPTGYNLSQATPGVAYNDVVTVGGTNGYIYDNMIIPGNTYRFNYTSSLPGGKVQNSYWHNGYHWEEIKFTAGTIAPSPITNLSSSFVMKTDSFGNHDGFTVNYSVNSNSNSTVYYKLQDQYQPSTVLSTGYFTTKSGVVTSGSLTATSLSSTSGNQSGYGLYPGHTYSFCMSYKYQSVAIDCSAVPTGGTSEIHKTSYTIPLFESAPTVVAGRGYIDLTYKVKFDSKQPAYNYFTVSIWDQTNSKWVTSQQVVDYNGDIGTAQTIRFQLESETVYDIHINPSPWDGEVLNSNGTTTDPYANNYVFQDLSVLPPMIHTSNSVVTAGYSQLNWNYYLNYPSEAVTMNMSLYSAGQDSTTASPLVTYSEPVTGQSSTSIFDISSAAIRGGTYEFYAYVDETSGIQSEKYHKQVVLDDGLEDVDQNSVALSGPTSATVNITWDSEQAGSIYYRTDFNNNGDFNDDQWFHSKDIAANSAGVQTITIDHLVSNKANQQVQLSMYPSGLNPTGVAAPNDIVTFTVPQTTSLGMKEYRVSSTKPNDVQFQFKYDTQGSSSYEYVSVYYSDGTGTPAGSPIYTGQMLIEANTNTSTFWLSDTTPYNGSADWTDTTLTSNTSYWLVFSFEDPSGSGNKAKTHFTTD